MLHGWHLIDLINTYNNGRTGPLFRNITWTKKGYPNELKLSREGGKGKCGQDRVLGDSSLAKE